MQRYQKKFQEYSKQIHTYKNRNVFDTNHAIKRFHERFPELKLKDYYQVLENGIDIILDIMKDSEGKYIIISKSKKIGIQLNWRKDNKSSDNLNHGFTATTLHRDDNTKVFKKDTKLFVERIKADGYMRLYESDQGIIDTTGYYDILLEDDFKLYLSNGSINMNYELIEVD